MEGQEMVKPKKSRAKYEVVIILVVIVAAAAVAFGIFQARSKSEKNRLMISELEQIRSAVETYKMLNKANPPDLVSLTKMTYSFAPGEGGKSYLSGVKANSKGELVDPFGNPYVYDSRKAWVESSTKGYGDW